MSKQTGDAAVRYLREHSDAILIVDGAAISRSNLRRNLEYYGFKVVDAADEAQALEHLSDRKARIGLMVLDVMTTGGAARTLVPQLLEKHPHLPILLCTDKAPSEIRMTDRTAGIVGMLRKPVRTDKLLVAVSKALGV
jgi:DNA-binding NtrC family response regulator